MNEVQAFTSHLREEPTETTDPYLQTCAQVIRDVMNHPAFYQPAPLTPEKLDAFRAKLNQVPRMEAVPISNVLKPRSHAAIWSLSLAASILFVISVVRFWPETNAEKNTPIQLASRSIDGQLVLLADDPAATIDKLQASLTALDIESNATAQAEQWQLEAFVPEAKELQVNQILQPYQLTVGKNGSLSIVVRKP